MGENLFDFLREGRNPGVNIQAWHCGIDTREQMQQDNSKMRKICPSSRSPVAPRDGAAMSP